MHFACLVRLFFRYYFAIVIALSLAIYSTANSSSAARTIMMQIHLLLVVASAWAVSRYQVVLGKQVLASLFKSFIWL
jgi:hypothetical protein